VLSALAQVSLTARAPLPAILTLQTLTRFCPSVAQYHFMLGVGLMQAGDIAAAIESLQEAQRLEPDRVLTLLALGLSLNIRKRYGDAKSALQRGLELDPDNVDALASLAEADEGLGDTQAADEHARRALARVPAHATGNLVMGMILMTRGEYAPARDALLKAIAADPSSSKALYQLSLAYARLGDDAAAQKYVGLYRDKLREVEARVEELRARTGSVGSGTER
jgi:tetratricopeptide (TPR) repeat protein